MNLYTDIKFSNNLIESRTCTVTYSGVLFKNNSDNVSIVYGFENSWQNTTEQKMTKTENGFTAKIKLLDFENINFCFKNSNNEWDNNNNFNYTAPISKILEENFIINEDILDNILDNIFNCDLSEMTSENLVHATQEIVEETTTLESDSNIIDETIALEPDTETNEPLYSEITCDLANTIENTTPENLFDNIEDDIVDEDFPIDFTQNSNFDMDGFVEDILSPITQASVLADNTLFDEENNTENEFNISADNTENNIETISSDAENNDLENGTIDFINEESDLEEDKKIDGLIDTLITNLYEKANSNKEVSQINIIDNNVTPLEDAELNNTENNIENEETPLENIESTNIKSTTEIDALISKIINTNPINTTDTEIENIEKIEDNIVDVEESLFDSISTDIPKIKQHSETSLIEATDNFIVSSKSLSKFYMMRKKIKLAFYKLMALPKIIFGSNEN